jgi:hypothetical protein
MLMSTVSLAPKINPPRRAHKRFSMRFSLEVTGKDENGHSFRAVALMRNVSAGGGCMAIVKDLAKGDLVKLVSSKPPFCVAKVRWSRYHYISDHRFVGFDIVEGKQNWVLRDIPLSWFFKT